MRRELGALFELSIGDYGFPEVLVSFFIFVTLMVLYIDFLRTLLA